MTYPVIRDECLSGFPTHREHLVLHTDHYFLRLGILELNKGIFQCQRGKHRLFWKMNRFAFSFITNDGRSCFLLLEISYMCRGLRLRRYPACGKLAEIYTPIISSCGHSAVIAAIINNQHHGMDKLGQQSLLHSV